MKEVKQSIFQNLAIKCTDWNQMLQLEEMAEKEGRRKINIDIEWFNSGCKYFYVFKNKYSCTYDVATHETEISFDQFIQSLNQK